MILPQITAVCRIGLYCALFLFVFGPAAPAQTNAAPTLRIQVPTEFNSERLIFNYGGRPNLSLAGATVAQSKLTESHGYFVPLEQAQSVRFVLAYPGYKVISQEITANDPLLAMPMAPHFEKLPTTPLRVRLVNSHGEPLAGQQVHLTYWLTEVMSFFGYSDGPCPIMKIADATTDAAGAAVLTVPLIQTDPFMVKYEAQGGHREFRVDIGSNPRVSYDYTIAPAFLRVQAKYPQTVIITKRVNGILKGHFLPSFFIHNAIIGSIPKPGASLQYNPFSLELRPEKHFTPQEVSRPHLLLMRLELQQDGRFFGSLAPGLYDLYLYVFKPGQVVERRVLAQANVTVREDQNSDVEIK